jgi:SP family sugar:H+ symporter-like MFS transporter
MSFLKISRPPGASSASVLPSLLIGAFVSFGGVLFGYDTGTIAGILAMKFWIKQMATGVDGTGAPFVTPGQTSLIVSMLSAGTFVGMNGKTSHVRNIL